MDWEDILWCAPWHTSRHLEMHVVALGFAPSLLFLTPNCRLRRLLRLERHSIAFMGSHATV